MVNKTPAGCALISLRLDQPVSFGLRMTHASNLIESPRTMDGDTSN